jgi:oxygen-independent coproporphyrinogen-3 oxidase
LEKSPYAARKAPEDETVLWSPRLSNPARQSPALYVGIPFCKTICTYCDFNVYAHLGRLFDAYVDALGKEFNIVTREMPSPLRVRSLAFGGGTPSILPTSLLVKLFESLYAVISLEPDDEVTLEANPGTIDLDKLRVLKELGVNRLSLGVQTFDDAQLKAFNRHHDSASSLEAFAMAREAGFENINIDLIFGLPDQTMVSWSQTLDRALLWRPEHMSLYGLQVEEGTAIARQIEGGRVHAPDRDLAADMFCSAEEKLQTEGYEHYEISNYAKPGYRSRHNQTYWLNHPYIGIGAGAHSYIDGARYSNLRSPVEYLRHLEVSEPVVASREVISREMEMGETLMLGLRLEEGIAFEDFRARFGVDVREIHGATIAQMEEWGLMQSDAVHIRLTKRGRLLSNQVLWRFLPDEVDSKSGRRAI